MDDTDAPDETGDPSVPPELIELHIALEDQGATPEQLQEWADAADPQD